MSNKFLMFYNENCLQGLKSFTIRIALDVFFKSFNSLMIKKT